MGSHPQPRESLWLGLRQGGRCWTGPACATANTCGAGYANAWPKAKGVGRKRFCLNLVIVTLQRGYLLLKTSNIQSLVQTSNFQMLWSKKSTYYLPHIDFMKSRVI